MKKYRFTLLLCALLVLLVGYPLIKGDEGIRLLYDALVILVFVCALPIFYRRQTPRIVALVLGIPPIVGIVLNYSLPETPILVTTILFHLLPVCFLLYLVVNILQGIFEEGEVSRDGVNGAFAGYLLLGLAFGHLYCFCESIYPGSFLLADHVAPMPPEGHQRRFLLTYFSLVTLTTVGYGDILPLSPAARTMAWFEAVLGQFYVTVVIAELISLKVSAALSPPAKQNQPGV